MNYVSKSMEKVKVASRSDAISLITALNEHNCTDTVKRQEVVGLQTQAQFEVSFGGETINVCDCEDAERVAHWMLSLECNEVSIKRIVG